jgi:hypothetical protein
MVHANLIDRARIADHVLGNATGMTGNSIARFSTIS